MRLSRPPHVRRVRACFGRDALVASVASGPELLPATGRSYMLATSRTAFPRNLVLEGLAMPWQLVYLNEGKTLKLLCARGTAILLR